MMQPQSPTVEEMDTVYERYLKPLEAEHWGEYAVISPDDGRMLLGTDLRTLEREAAAAFGAGNYAFKIGSRAIGRI